MSGYGGEEAAISRIIAFVCRYLWKDPVKVLKQLQQALTEYVHLKRQMQLDNPDQRKSEKEDARDIDWKKSPQGVIKINGYFSFLLKDNKAAVGVLGQDYSGVIAGGRA